MKVCCYETLDYEMLSRFLLEIPPRELHGKFLIKKFLPVFGILDLG